MRILLLSLLAADAVLVFVAKQHNVVADPDLWGYLAFGRDFFTTGFPYGDTHAFVPVLDVWVYHEWLTGVTLYALLERFGLGAMQAVKLLLLGLSNVLVYRLAKRRGGAPWLCLAALIACIVAQGAYSAPVRANVFTIFFFTLSLALLERARTTGRLSALWLLVVVQVLWCNFHGGFLVGVILIWLYVLFFRDDRRNLLFYLAIALAATAASLVNPYGVRYLAYLVEAIAKKRIYIAEWHSALTALTTGAYRGEAVFGLVLVGLFATRLRKFRAFPAECAVFFAFAYAFVSHVRHLIFMVILFAVYMPALSQGVFEAAFSRLGRSSMRVLRLVALAGLVVVCVDAGVRGLASDYGEVLPTGPQVAGKAPWQPVAALTRLAALRERANVMCDFAWGEYVIWAYPQFRVGMDGRYETVYPESYEREYFDFLYGADDPGPFLDRYGADAVLIKATDPAYAAMNRVANWEKVFDDGAALYLRRP